MRPNLIKRSLSVRSLVITFVFLAYGVTVLASQDVVIRPPSSCSFYGDFKQSKFLRGLDKAIESNGVFFFNCDRGVIWKTQTPVEETLVLKKDGNSSKIEQGQAIPLSSRQGKLLGQLINGLMGADSKFINDNFDVQNPTLQVPSDDALQALPRQSYVLSPKKRSLRRAITRIEMVTPARSSRVHAPFDNLSVEDQVAVDDQAVEEDQIVTISLLDRNEQWTHIISNKKVDYPQLESSVDQCLSSGVFGASECALFEQSQNL